MARKRTGLDGKAIEPPKKEGQFGYLGSMMEELNQPKAPESNVSPITPTVQEEVKFTVDEKKLPKKVKRTRQLRKTEMVYVEKQEDGKYGLISGVNIRKKGMTNVKTYAIKEPLVEILTDYCTDENGDAIYGLQAEIVNRAIAKELVRIGIMNEAGFEDLL